MPASEDLASVRALVFDVFGTVVDWRGSIIAEGERDCSATDEIDGIARPRQGLADDQKKIQHRHRKPEKTERPKRPHEENSVGGMEAGK